MPAPPIIRISNQIKNIDIGKRFIYIPKVKAGAREQPITNNLAKFLGELLQSLEPPGIFVSLKETLQGISRVYD